MVVVAAVCLSVCSSSSSPCTAELRFVREPYLYEPNAGLSDMASREKRNLVPSQKNKQRANDSLSAETNNTSETNNSSINTTPSTGRKAKQSLANNVRNQTAQEASEVVGSQATSKVEAALPRKRAIQTALKKKQKAKKILIKPKVPIKTLKRIAEAKKILGKKKKGPAPKINQINIKTEPSENNINHTDLRNKSKTAKKATKNSAKANEEAKKLIKPPPKLLRNSRSSTASQKQEDLIVEEVKIKLEPIDYESTIESVVAASSMIIDDTIVKVEEEETEVEVKKLVKNPFSGKKNLRNGKLRSSSHKAELDAEKKAIMSDEDQQQQTSAESGSSSSSSTGPTVKSDVELAPHQFITVAHIETTSRSYEAEDIGRNSPATSTSSSSAKAATTNNAQQATRPASISRASAASEDEISRASPTPSEDRQSIASSTATSNSASTRRRSSLNDSTAQASGSTRRNSIASDPAVLDVMIESIKFNIAKSIESKVYDSKGFLLNGKSFEPPKAESSDDKTKGYYRVVGAKKSTSNLSLTIKEPSGGSSNKKEPEQQQQPGPSSLMATNAKKSSSSSSSAEDGTTMKTAASATPKLADTAKEIEKLVMGENDKAATITTSPGTNSTNSADYDSKATTTITAATSSADEQQLAADSAAKTPEKENEPDIVAANKVEEPAVNAPVVKAEPEVKKVSPTRRSTRVTALEARRSLSASDSQSLNSSSDDGKSNPKESSPSKSVEATVKSSATPMEIDESTVGKTAAPAEKSTKVATPPPTKTDTDKPIETLNKVADALEQQTVKSDADQKPEPMAVDAEEHDENELRLVIDESKENSVVDESETTAQDCDKMDSVTEASNLVDVPKVERTEQKAPTPRVLRTRGDKKKGDKIEKEEKTEPESAGVVNEKVEVNEKVNEEAPAKITENNDTKTESNSNDELQNVSKSEPPSEQSLNDESIVSVPDSEKVKIEPADLPADEQKDTPPEVPSKRRMREAKKRFPLKPPAKGKRGPRGRRAERKKSNTPTKEESALDNEVANINKCSNSEAEKSERRGNSAEVADNGTEVSPVNRSKSENDIGTVHRSASSISNGKESRESEESRDSKLMYDLNESFEEIVEAPAELAKKDFILGLLGLQVSENAENSKIQSDGRNSEEYAKRMAELEKLTPRKNKAKTHRAPIKTIIRVPTKDGETRKRSRSPIKMVLKQQGKQEGDNPDNIMYTIQKEAGASGQEESSSGANRKINTNPRHTLDDGRANSPIKDRQSLVIPEKASSFSIHPGQLCKDDCAFCRGKFGSLDTPMHLGSEKLAEECKKLKIEPPVEKDSCLCDACYRHINRKISGKPEIRPRTKAKQMTGRCIVKDCTVAGKNSIKRRYLTKLRSQLGKDWLHKKSDNAYPATVGFCDQHYQIASRYLHCSLCGTTLVRNYSFLFSQTPKNVEAMNNRFKKMGILSQMEVNEYMCNECNIFCKCHAKNSTIEEMRENDRNFCLMYRKKLMTRAGMSVSTSESETEDDADVKVDNENKPRTSRNEVSAEQALHITKIQLENEDISRDTSEKSTPEPPKEPPSKPEHSAVNSRVMNIENAIEKLKKRKAIDMNTTEFVAPENRPGSSSYTDFVSVDRDVSLTRLPKRRKTINNGGQAFSPDIAPVVERLGSNPSISVRTLFPGEEEMNLHVNVDFNNVLHTTPEGWERVSAIIQCDKETKTLWEFLQRPYGNLSSFFRHLILLEKYYRTGDLFLAPNASRNAINYSTSVQNRLISFEGPEKMEAPSDTPPFELNNSHRLSGGCIIEQRPSHSNSVTITPSSYISTNSTVTITPSTSAAGSSSAPMQQSPSVSIHPSNSTVSITPSSTPMSSSTVNITPPTSSITITPSNSIANVTAQLSRMDSSPRVVKLTSGVSIIKKPPPSLQRLQMNNVTATAVNGSAKRKESHPVQKNTGQSGKMMQLTEDDYMRYQTLKKQKISITSASKSSASGSSHSMLPKKTKSNVSVLEYGKAPPPNQLTFQQQIFRQQEMLNQRHPGDFEPIICDMRASANENSPTQNFLNLNLPKAIHVTKSTAPIATSTPRAHLPTKYPKNLLIIPQPMVQPQDK
ncbi:uncharacterized protein LOC106659633 isoform X3 [Trichogramma pretiosum]|uniref:uncharacterized protein LOC106659633 isoform X3 n=1 Tax=Trichogramma pretiosum TaxID=7493 RepID=UPI0006C953E3|nr:uncharacterized protein LOC106659633 isoform X3 [Trichogramma pretiosum]